MNIKQFIENCDERNVRLEELLESNKQAVKELDKKLDGNKKRRIYSINVASFLKSRGYDYTVHEDEVKSELRYFYFADDCSKELAEYKSNTELQNFIRAYADIRQQLHS